MCVIYTYMYIYIYVCICMDVCVCCFITVAMCCGLLRLAYCTVCCLLFVVCVWFRVCVCCVLWFAMCCIHGSKPIHCAVYIVFLLLCCLYCVSYAVYSMRWFVLYGCMVLVFMCIYTNICVYMCVYV